MGNAWSCEIGCSYHVDGVVGVRKFNPEILKTNEEWMGAISSKVRNFTLFETTIEQGEISHLAQNNSQVRWKT